MLSIWIGMLLYFCIRFFSSEGRSDCVVLGMQASMIQKIQGFHYSSRWLEIVSDYSFWASKQFGKCPLSDCHMHAMIPPQYLLTTQSCWKLLSSFDSASSCGQEELMVSSRFVFLHFSSVHHYIAGNECFGYKACSRNDGLPLKKTKTRRKMNRTNNHSETEGKKTSHALVNSQ